MAKILLSAIIFTILNIGVNAQTLKGKLLDATSNRPLRGASVSLTQLKDSTVKFNIASDNTGGFEFKNLTVDSFVLNVSFIGYDNFRQIVGVKDSVMDLGNLLIPKSIKQ